MKRTSLLTLSLATLAACGGATTAPTTTASPEAAAVEVPAEAQAAPGEAPTAPSEGDADEPSTGPTHIARAAELTFRPCAPPMPEGCEMAVLEGDPAAAGPFTVRIRADRPILVPPHVHPAASRVTVLSGTLNVGFQAVVDKAASVAFQTGDYYVNVAGTPHFVWTDGPAMLQLSATGPWGATPVGAPAN